MSENMSRPAEVFPPGEFLMEELEARGWNQKDLAVILGRPIGLVSEILSGKRGLTVETAQGLGDALGTSAEVWLKLEAEYRAAESESDGSVAQRARIFEKVPVREMLQRGWIKVTDDPSELEGRVLHFLGIGNLDEEPSLTRYAARKSTKYGTTTSAQMAWLFRCRQLARTLDVRRFTSARFDTALTELRSLKGEAEEFRNVPKVLAEAGIRLVVVQHLQGTKFDGACFWLNATSPVVALSGRYDRIDNQWHTLMHELGHILARDGLENIDYYAVDEDLGGQGPNERPQAEKDADSFAASFLVDQDQLENFIIRVAPLYSRQRILGFAQRLGVHAGIVVGQLHWRDEIPYSHNRGMLVKVRSFLTNAALTDGWGFTPPVAPIA